MDLSQKLINSIKYRDSYNIIKDMDKDGELEILLPITREMKSVGECKYHLVNCFEHSLLALKTFEEILNEESFFESHINLEVQKILNTNVDDNLTKRELLKLGILFHDMGKVEAKTVDNTGRVRFKKHEVIGANKISCIAKDIGLSDKNTMILYKYIRYHMSLLQLYKEGDMSKDRLFDIFNKLKDESIDVFLLGYADIVSTRRLLDIDENMNIVKTYLTYGITNYIYSYKKIYN